MRAAEQRFVYHAVHMIFNGDFMEPWAEDEERASKLVFIGKNLDKEGLRSAFAACLATPANLEKKRAALRFAIGERVACKMGNNDGWVMAQRITQAPARQSRQCPLPTDGVALCVPQVMGTITNLMWRSDDMDPGMVAPYQVRARARMSGLCTRARPSRPCRPPVRPPAPSPISSPHAPICAVTRGVIDQA